MYIFKPQAIYFEKNAEKYPLGKELLEKYAEVLLKSCLKVEKDQPLLISGDMERIDFIRILEKYFLSLNLVT